jgi:hypothetical protein
MSLAVQGNTTILWKLPDSYRCLSYGDITQEERRLRWIARRWITVIALLLCSYVMASGPWMAAIRTGSIPAAGLPARAIEISFLPLKVACHLCPPMGLALRPWHELCDSVFMRKTTTGRSQPAPLWWAWVAAWVAAAYALSPVPTWLAACLFGIERSPPVSELMGIVFAPLVVLADFSTNVREFYEAYGDWREAID